MNKNNLLICPNCGGEWFNRITVNKFKKSTRVDFQSLPAVESQTVYHCFNPECGLIVDSLEEPNKTLLIITGNSAGYRRIATKNAGFEAREWEHLWFFDKNILFVTKDTKKNHPEKFEHFLADSLVQELDISDGNYDPEELKQIVAEYMN